MAGKYSKTGIFPILREETHTTTGATTWGSDTTKEVGVIKVAGAHAVTFDTTNYPGEPGDCVLMVNTHSSGISVTITPDPFGDETADLCTLGAGDSVAVIYHPDNGWLFFGGTTADVT